MHTVHITAISRDRFVDAARAVREAYALMAEDNPQAVSLTLEDAGAILEEAGANPPKLILKTEDRDLAYRVWRALNVTEVMRAFMDLDVEEFKRRVEGKPARTPEEVFAGRSADHIGAVASEHEPEEVEVFSTQAYETAMVLMTMTEGNPLRAAAQAHALGRTTGDEDFYTEVKAALVHAFPWLESTLRENGMLS
jgi:hypothetical protein